MPLGTSTRVVPRNHVLAGGPDPSKETGNFGFVHQPKSIRRRKQQTLQKYGAADMSVHRRQRVTAKVQLYNGPAAAAGGGVTDKCGRCGLWSKRFNHSLGSTDRWRWL